MPERRSRKSLSLQRTKAGKTPRAAKKLKKISVSKKRKATATARPQTATASAKASAVAGLQLRVMDLKGNALESMPLDPLFREGSVNTDVIHQAVVQIQAGQREGTASTKDRGHVSGGGKKPWKQKGTGQARHGSRRSPIWRHGGVTFGPMPRDYSYQIPQAMRRRAVVECVKEKALNGKLVLLQELLIEEPKTKRMAEVVGSLRLEKPLFVVDQKSRNLELASRNLQGLAVRTAQEVNALDIAAHRECVLTKAAYAGLIQRLKS